MQQSFKDYNGIIIVSDSTIGEGYSISDADLICTNNEGLKKTTLLNYIYRNQENSRLKRIPEINYVFSSEYHDTVKYKANVFLSRIGYNETKTQAMVTIGIIFGPLAGYGSMFIFERNNDGWYIYKQYATWIS